MRYFLFCAWALSACQPCDGNVVVTVQLPDYALAADQLQVSATVFGAAGETQMGTRTAPHSPGESSGTVNLHVGRYQPGDVMSIEVLALQEGSLLAGSIRTLRLSGSCSSFTMDLSVTEIDVRVEQAVKNKADILFMVDDSSSMGPKQDELKARFPELIKVLDNFGASGSPASYHIGVVTSDLGAGAANNGCAPGGLGARLQPLGRGSAASCQPPGGGLNFIDYNQLAGTNNLPVGVSLPDQFNCMASVGAGGCGFEHQLEAVYKALHDCMPAADGSYPNCTIPENKNFLRPDSVLAVVFVTDEDDCSAPMNTDLFDQAKTSQYGPRTSFRCSNYGVECGTELLPYGDSGGALADCHAAPNPGGAGPGKLFDVQKYVDFFHHSSLIGDGVRPDPDDVILAAIDGPSEPVETRIGNGDTGTGCPAGAMVGEIGCQVYLGYSCNASATFFGNPAVRINQVVNSGKAPQVTSICAQDYTSALTALGIKIISKIGIACLSSPLTDINDPDCVVQDVSNVDNSVVGTIAYCHQNGGAKPCWQYEPNDNCPPLADPRDPGQVTQGSIAIQRDFDPPPGTHASVTCLAVSPPGVLPLH